VPGFCSQSFPITGIRNSVRNMSAISAMSTMSALLTCCLRRSVAGEGQPRVAHALAQDLLPGGPRPVPGRRNARSHSRMQRSAGSAALEQRLPGPLQPSHPRLGSPCPLGPCPRAPPLARSSAPPLLSLAPASPSTAPAPSPASAPAPSPSPFLYSPGSPWPGAHLRGPEAPKDMGVYHGVMV